jgi:hypothetical protein
MFKPVADVEDPHRKQKRKVNLELHYPALVDTLQHEDWEQRGQGIDAINRASVRRALKEARHDQKMLGMEMQSFLHKEKETTVDANVRDVILGAQIGKVTNYKNPFKSDERLSKALLDPVLAALCKDTAKLAPNQRRVCAEAGHAFVMLSFADKAFYADGNGYGESDKEVMSFTGDKWKEDPFQDFNRYKKGKYGNEKTSGKEALAGHIMGSAAEGDFLFAVKTKSERLPAEQQAPRQRKHGSKDYTWSAIDESMDGSRPSTKSGAFNDKGFEWDLMKCTDYTWAPGTPDVAAKAADKAAAKAADIATANIAAAKRNGQRTQKSAEERAAQRARLKVTD